MFIHKKKAVVAVLFGTTVLLMLLPLVVSFNEVLTQIVEQNVLYGWLQKNIVPIEAKMMGVLLMPFNYTYAYSPSNSLIVVNGITMSITWNCLGWQSFVLLFSSFIIGFRGKYKKMSMLEALTIGIFGTFWLNILRMLFTVLLAVHLMPIFRIVFHDYLAAISSIVWLFFFWWFSYRFILKEEEVVVLS